MTLQYDHAYGEERRPTVTKCRESDFQNAPDDPTKPWMATNPLDGRHYMAEPEWFSSQDEAIQWLTKILHTSGRIHPDWKESKKEDT